MYRLPEERERTVEELQKEQETIEHIIEKYKVREVFIGFIGVVIGC